jgi:alpha-L-rhamnosidase
VAEPQIHDLRVETLTEPIGLTEMSPRLSWKLSHGTQTAYRIRVGTAPGGNDLWDTGRVEAAARPSTPYGGRPLNSREKAFWSVTVWGDFGEAHSHESHWEMGLLSASDWKAKWIESALVGGPKTTVPVPLMRCEFSVDKPVKEARLYITALGLFAAEINGHEIGNEKLAPGWTDYRKRVLARAFDVTHHLKHGANAIGVMLADGWYAGHDGWRDRQFYGDRPKLLVRLEARHPDGTVTEVVSNEAWMTATGPILEADLQMGESYDARREVPGWSSAGKPAGAWTPATVADLADAPMLLGTGCPPMRVIEEIKPKTVTERAPGRYVYDLGQNMVGHVRLRLSGKVGQTVTLRHAERLQPNGEIYVENLRKARATDHYTFAKDGEAVWEPRFTFHGFQYVEVTGVTEAPPLSAVTGVVVATDLKEPGQFHCNLPPINQLWHNIRWGWRGNRLSVPTDCPQRDERLGWTGDAQVFSRTANYVSEAQSFYEKYTQDLTDSQHGDGQIPPFAPYIGDNPDDGGPAWADAFAVVPWETYLDYGEARAFERHYPALRTWLKAQNRTSKEGIRCYEGYQGFRGFGDWLNTDGGTDVALIGTAYYARSSEILRQMAEVLGKHEDAAQYAAWHAEAVAGFRREFLDGEGKLKKPTQTGCVLALEYHLAPEEARAAIGEQLVKDIEARHDHLSTGFVGSSHLSDALTSLGRLDVAYKLLEQKTWPSWLYAVTRGATTIWERWDGWTEEKGYQDPGMNSFNHYAYGAIGAWMMGTVAGIRLHAPSRRLTVSPRPGGSLTEVSASFDSVFGKVSSSWKRGHGRFEGTVEVPGNVMATLTFPPETAGWQVNGKACAQVSEMGPGTYHLAATWS